jgi:hypothetical protein
MLKSIAACHNRARANIPDALRCVSKHEAERSRFPSFETGLRSLRVCESRRISCVRPPHEGGNCTRRVGGPA